MIVNRSIEQAKIVAIDRNKGRVSLSLRNGLITAGTYMYDLAKLRVGMNVLVSKVSGKYVILNLVYYDEERKVSYALGGDYVGGSRGSGGTRRGVTTITYRRTIGEGEGEGGGPGGAGGPGWNDNFYGGYNTDKWLYSEPPPVVSSGRMYDVIGYGAEGVGASCRGVLRGDFSVSVRVGVSSGVIDELCGLIVDDYPYSGNGPGKVSSRLWYWNNLSVENYIVGDSWPDWIVLPVAAPPLVLKYVKSGSTIYGYCNDTYVFSIISVKPCAITLAVNPTQKPISKVYFEDFEFQYGAPLTNDIAYPGTLFWNQAG